MPLTSDSGMDAVLAAGAAPPMSTARAITPLNDTGNTVQSSASAISTHATSLSFI